MRENSKRGGERERENEYEKAGKRRGVRERNKIEKSERSVREKGEKI